MSDVFEIKQTSLTLEQKTMSALANKHNNDGGYPNLPERVAVIESRLTDMDRQLLEIKLDARDFKKEITNEFDKVSDKFDKVFVELDKNKNWLIGTLLTIIASVVAGIILVIVHKVPVPTSNTLRPAAVSISCPASIHRENNEK